MGWTCRQNVLFSVMMINWMPSGLSLIAFSLGRLVVWHMFASLSWHPVEYENDWYWWITWRDLQKIKAYLTALCFKPSSNLFVCGSESSVTRFFLYNPPPPTSRSFLLHFFSRLHPLFFYPSLPHLMTRTSHGMAFHVTRQQAENKRRGALKVPLNSMCFFSPLFLFHSLHFFPSLLSLPSVSHRKLLALHIVVTLETVVFAVQWRTL